MACLFRVEDVILLKMYATCSSETLLAFHQTNKILSQNYALLGYYAAISGNILRTFRVHLSVPSSRVKNQTSSLDP